MSRLVGGVLWTGGGACGRGGVLQAFLGGGVRLTCGRLGGTEGGDLLDVLPTWDSEGVLLSDGGGQLGKEGGVRLIEGRVAARPGAGLPPEAMAAAAAAAAALVGGVRVLGGGVGESGGRGAAGGGILGLCLGGVRDLWFLTGGVNGGRAFLSLPAPDTPTDPVAAAASSKMRSELSSILELSRSRSCSSSMLGMVSRPFSRL